MHKEIGNDIMLRTILYGDAIGLAKHGNNEKIAVNQRDSYPFPYTIEHARQWIKFVREHYAKTKFVIATSKEAIGEIGFSIQPDVHCYSGEISYWLGEEYWGQGITTQALQAVIEYAFKVKGLKRLYADIIEYNYASQRVLQKCGFQIDGIMRKHMFKNGQFYDLLVFSRLANDDPPPLH